MVESQAYAPKRCFFASNTVKGVNDFWHVNLRKIGDEPLKTIKKEFRNFGDDAKWPRVKTGLAPMRVDDIDFFPLYEFPDFPERCWREFGNGDVDHLDSHGFEFGAIGLLLGGRDKELEMLAIERSKQVENVPRATAVIGSSCDEKNGAA